MDAISAQRLLLLYPELQRRWRAVDATLVNQGVEVQITLGLRSWSEQNALYAQGRTAPGHIVTYAQGGQSWHNYGVALDFVPILNGIPQWNTSYPAWATTIKLAKQWGFTSGSDWPAPKTDFPHLQLTAPYGDTPGNDVQAIYSMHSFAGVWQAMNNYRGIVYSAANNSYVSNPYS